MSAPGQSGPESTLTNRQEYLLQIALLRQRVTEHLAGLGISRDGLGITVHKIPKRVQKSLFDSKSNTHVMVHSKLPPQRTLLTSQPNISIVTKEILAAEPQGRTPWLINHFGLSSWNRARLRHHGELLDHGKYTDEIIGGPVFFVSTEDDNILYAQTALDRIQDEDDDDFIFNETMADRYRALAFANAVLDLLPKSEMYNSATFEA